MRILTENDYKKEILNKIAAKYFIIGLITGSIITAICCYL